MLDLHDTYALTDLVSRYNHAIDHWDSEAWAATFAPDGVLFANGEMRARGTADLAAYVEKMRAAGKPRFRHFTSNLIVDGAGSEARLQVYMIAFDVSAGLANPYLLGEYDDHVVRAAAGWVFQTRRMTVVAGDLSAAAR